jgi:hypothetical protein
MSVKFLAQGNNDLPLTGFEPMRLAIIRLFILMFSTVDGHLDLVTDSEVVGLVVSHLWRHWSFQSSKLYKNVSKDD